MIGDIGDYDTNRYRPGLGRDIPYPKKSHLYEVGNGIMDFKGPMCKRGFNREDNSYSIFRNNVGVLGICKICISRAKKNLKGL